MTEVLSFPPVIFGNMARHPQSTQARVQVISAALEAGFNTIDTAPLYDFGAAEEQLGEVLATLPRDQVQVLGKVGLRWDADARGDVLFVHTDGRTVRRDSRPETLRWQVEQSLRRLRTDYLDLVQIHQPDRTVPLGESLDALHDLRREGLVRSVGVCNFDPPELEVACAASSLASVQLPYSLLERQIEWQLLPLCRNQDVDVLAYSPLAGGALAATRLAADAKPQVSEIADQLGVPVNVVPLSWVLSRAGVTSVITGASSQEQIAELAATPAGLPAEAVTQLDVLFRAQADARALTGLDPLRRLVRRARIWRSRHTR